MSTGKFFSLLFSANQKQIDPSTFRISQFDDVHSSSDAMSLFKFAVDSKNEEYLKAALNMVFRLCQEDTSKVIASQLGDAGICSLVDTVFGQRIADIQMSNHSLQVMYVLMVSPEQSLGPQRRVSNDSSLFSSIAENSTIKTLTGSSPAISNAANRQRFSSAGTLFRIIKCGLTHINEVGLLISVLKVLKEFLSEDEIVGRLVSCGVCDLLTQILRQHTLNETILPVVCDLIYQLVLFDVDQSDSVHSCQDKFAEFFLCEQLINKILLNYADELTIHSIITVFKAIGALSRRHEGNKQRFASVGACKLLPELSRSKKSFLENAFFAEAICWAFGNLAFPDADNQLALGESGACSLIFDLLKLHSQNRLVVQEGMRAVRNLCQSCDENCLRVIELNGIAFIMELISLFQKEPDVLQWIMFCLASLSDQEMCRYRLGQANITNEIAMIMQKYSDNEDVLQWTCLVASNVARDDVLTKELHKNRVCEALVNILAKHYKNCDLMEEALNVIAVIAGASVDARSTFIDQTICEFLVKILSECENEETTVEQTLLAFSSVLSIHTDCIDLAQNEPLLCAHSFHSDERAVLQLSLARKYKAFLDDFLNAGGVKTLCRVISKYSAGNQFIAHYGSQCLCGLSMAALLAIDRSDVTASDRVLSVLRVGLIQGNSAQRSLLTLLGDCGGITILTQILGSYYQHKSIAKWSLLAILQLLTIEKNLELLKQTEICLFLSKLLEFYTFSAQEKDDNIFILSYEIIVQLCLFVECRNALGNYFVSFSSTHLLLTSLAHNLHSVEILRAGAEALSALCISPLEDALATIYKQQEHTEKRKSIKARSSLSAATNLLTGSASIAADGSAEGDTGALDWMKFESPQKAGAADVPSTDPEEQKDSKSSGFFSSFSFFRSRADTNPQAAESGPSQQSTDDRRRAVTMSTLDSYNNLPTSKANNRFVEAASSLVSSGMSDQEEMLIAQRRQQNVIRKTSAEVLVESGIVALLVSAIQAHPTHEGVLCAALNTLNTMAVNPLNREKFDDPLIFEVLVESLKAFLDIPSEGIAEDVGGDNDHEGGNSSSKRMSVRTITTSLEARRAVRILLLIVIGTVCMPVTDEESFQKSKGLQKKSTAAANIAAHHSALKIHEQNQENFATLNVFVLFLELLQTYSSDSLMSEALLRAIYYSINGNLVNQNRFADLKLIHSTDIAHMKPKEPALAPPSPLTRLDSEDEHRRVTETDVPAKKEVLVSDSILLLVEILRQNVDKPRVIYYAGLAISAISNNHRDNSFQFGLLNICELVIQILTTFIENHVEIIQSCCQVIFNLKSLNHLWGKYNTCELILMALTIHPNNPVVAEWVCRVIGTLAENDHNKMELEKHSVCKVIVGAIQKHVSTDSLLSLSLSTFMKDNSSEGVARWGCTAIYFLAKGYQADLFQESLVSAGACEAVAKTLVKYSEDETIAYCSCRALVVLLMNNETYKSKLGSLGVCGCIVESLHLFPSSAQVAKWGCRAVAVLAENNEPNVGKLAIAGACETIPLVIQSHPTNEHVAQAGCDVISFMSEQIGNGFAARFGHAGACEAVVSVLRKHPNNNQVVARCSIALGSLARVPGNARWFGPAGAPDALYNVLVLHRKDVLVAKYIISAIGNLCLVDHNKERLGGLGVCEEIIFAANLHSKDLETAIASAAAIWKLCETIHKHAPKGSQAGNSLPTKDVRDGSSDEQQAASSDRSLPLPLAVDPEVSDNNLMNDPEKALRLKQSPHFLQGRRNRAILLQMNVCQTLVVLLNFHLADIVAAETICHAVSVLAAVGNACDEERNAFGDLGTCEAVVKALSFHEGNEEVARWGSMAVRSLCHKHPTNQLRFARTQIAKVLVLSLRGFRSAVTAVANHQMLMEAVLGAVVNLSNNCPENKVLFGETGLCEALLELLDLHIKNFEIVYLTVKALFHLCDGNQYNRMKISFSGAADFLMTCLTRFPDEDKLVDFILAIMIGMCFDKVGQSKLGGVGMPKHIFVLLNRYEKLSSEYLTLLCVVFMGILANGSKDNKEKLGAQNPQKVLIPILQKYLQANLVSSSSAGLSQQQSNGGAAGNFLSSTLNTIRRGSIMLSSLQAGAGAGGLSAQNSPMAVSSSAAPFSEEMPSPLPAQIPDEAHLLNNNNANADQTLASYIGEFSILKECCRTVYFLCYESEANRLKFQQVSVTVEILTTIMSSTYRPASSLGAPEDQGRESSQEAYTEEIRSWAKKAMDVLEGSV